MTVRATLTVQRHGGAYDGRSTRVHWRDGETIDAPVRRALRKLYGNTTARLDKSGLVASPLNVARLTGYVEDLRFTQHAGAFRIRVFAQVGTVTVRVHPRTEQVVATTITPDDAA